MTIPEIIEDLKLIAASIEWENDLGLQVTLEKVITILKDDDIAKIIGEKYGE